jgi:N-acetylmuramoyl-L-alanine amidase
MRVLASLLVSFSLAATITFAFGAIASASEPLHVMIDPGHGGSDNGTARGILKEKELVLKVSFKLAELLKADPRFKVSLTRTSDHKIALKRRTKLAEDAKADLFLSIHINSSPDAKVRGTEIYFQNQLPADEESLYLVSKEAEGEEDADTKSEVADSKSKSEPLSTRNDLKRILEDLNHNHHIQQASEFSKTLIETMAAKHAAGRRVIRQAPFQVVTNIGIPSILVELGFITNPIEGPRLGLDDYQRELAQTLFEGLVKYKESVDKDAAETLHSRE